MIILMICDKKSFVANFAEVKASLFFSVFTAYSFDFANSSKSSGSVAVKHMGVTGRVCNINWDDNDAHVLCKAKGYADGIAFHYSRYNSLSRSSSARSPFWVSSVNCTGNETRMEDCPFNDRLHLGNCSKADSAGALCLSGSGEHNEVLTRMCWVS